jgi:DNA-damage-inducible protein J
MAITTFVRARVKEEIKNEAAAVLAEMGLTVSDAVRITLTKIAQEKALPFEMRVPNALTKETLTRSKRGENLHHPKDAETMFTELGI